MPLEPVALPNLKMPQPDLATGGQPTAAQLQALQASGLKQIINLRPPMEPAGFDEPALAAQLGVGYQCIAVAGPAGLTEDNVKAFDAALATVGDQPLLVHCASGNRVGALYALRANWLQGIEPNAALDIGRAHGLTAMEPAVAAMLR